MEAIRIGNDINIEWTIFRDGKPESLDGKNISVFMTNGYRKMEVKDLHFRDNVIRFTYLGKDQDYNGVYTLTLIENKGKEGMYTVDACDAFRLIPRSCSVGGDTGCGSVKVTTVRLTGDISVPAVGTGDYESMTNKPRINGVELVGDKSLEELGIPILPDNIVTDADYTHTDNNLTDALLKKLDGLSNYDDTALREALTSEISRAKEVEGDLDTAIRKVASDLSTFITGDPDADNIINRWQEVVEFLSGMTEDKDMAGVLLDLKKQILAEVTSILSGYYTSGQIDDRFVEKIKGKGLSTNDLTDELLSKINGLSNYDDEWVRSEIASIKADIDTLLGDGASDAIDTFHEIELFLQGITDKETLTGLLNDLRAEITALIPTKTSQLTNDDHIVKDANYVHTDNNYTDEDKGKLDGIAAGAEVNVNADWNATEGDALILNKPTLATVATSGSYNDLTGKPTIPTVDVNKKYVDDKLATKADLADYTVFDIFMKVANGDTPSISQEDYNTLLEKLPNGFVNTLPIRDNPAYISSLFGGYNTNGDNSIWFYAQQTMGVNHCSIQMWIRQNLDVETQVNNDYLIPVTDGISIQASITDDSTDPNVKEVIIHTTGDGTKALMDDGTYKSIPSLEDQYAYGVEWDTASSSPDGVRVGNMQLHRELPVQSKMRRCLLDRDGGVKEYLDNELSWGGSYLDYAVMTEIPEHWYKLYFNGTKFRMMLSEIPLPGYKHVDKFYISTYEARMYRTDNLLCSEAGASKLSDPNSTNFRGGDNTAEWDDTYRSLLGRPVTNLTRDQFRQAARKRGSGWEMYTYNAHKTLFWLFAVEYATLDSQKPFNAQKDANGFAQGGLGPGPTQMTDWTNFNNANPLIPCGYTNEFGNGSGEKAYVVKNASGGTHATLMANRYRGIENPFGHIWKYTDGANIQVTTGDSGLSILWTTDDPSNFSDTSYTGYDKKGNICRTNGYAKKMLLGEDGDIVATEVGGSSSTYWCDYYYTYTQANRLQVVLVGGRAVDGSDAGLAYVNAANAPSDASRRLGSRLCFFPEFRKTSA